MKSYITCFISIFFFICNFLSAQPRSGGELRERARSDSAETDRKPESRKPAPAVRETLRALM